MKWKYTMDAKHPREIAGAKAILNITFAQEKILDVKHTFHYVLSYRKSLIPDIVMATINDNVFPYHVLPNL